MYLTTQKSFDGQVTATLGWTIRLKQHYTVSQGSRNRVTGDKKRHFIESHTRSKRNKKWLKE